MELLGATWSLVCHAESFTPRNSAGGKLGTATTSPTKLSPSAFAPPLSEPRGTGRSKPIGLIGPLD